MTSPGHQHSSAKMEAKEDASTSKCAPSRLPDSPPAFTSSTPATPSTAAPNNKSFVYCPLSEGYIRLLRIQPGPDPSATIECSIVEYPIVSSQRTGQYEALSYVWGPPPPSENPPFILVDGREFIVGENLHAALLSLRDPWLERIVWIDAICINQKDEDEKGQQVQSMAKIYARARGVVVWLGPATASSKRAMKMIQAFAMFQFPDDTGTGSEYVRIGGRFKAGLKPDFGLQVIPRRGTPSRAAELIRSPEATKEQRKQDIKELLESPWFRRVWVLQEIAAARQVVIKCGGDEIAGEAFCSGLESVMLRWQTASSNKTHKGESDDREIQVLRSLFEPTTRIMKDAGRRPRHEEGVSPRFYLNISPLNDLIELYSQREATDRRDKICALLGMCSDDPGAADLLPNYRISWNLLLQQLAVFLWKLPRPVMMDTWDISDIIVIDTWDNSDIIVIKSKGYVLGMLVANDHNMNIFSRAFVKKQRRWKDVHLRWSKTARELGWNRDKERAPLMFEDLLEGDVLFLLEGARIPMLIRPEKDYSTVLHAAVDMDPPEIRSVPLSSESVDVLLLWNWGPVAESLQPEYFMDSGLPSNAKDQYEGDLNKMTRLINTLLLRHSSMTTELYETHTKSHDMHHDEVLSSPGHNLNIEHPEVEMELLEIYERMWLSTAEDRRNADNVIIKLLSRASGLDSDWPVCRSLLWLAALTERKALAQHILELGVVSGFREVRLAATQYFLAPTIQFLLSTGKLDPMAKDAEWWEPAVDVWKRFVKSRRSTEAICLAEEKTKEPKVQIVFLFMSMGQNVKEDMFLNGLCWHDLDMFISLAKEYRVDLQVRNKHGRTLLMQAAARRHEELVRYLVANGHAPNQNVQDNEGRTALMLAITSESYGPFYILLSAGLGRLDANDNQGRTALMLAAYHGQAKMVKSLIETDQSQPHARDKHGQTALLYAMFGRKSEYDGDHWEAAIQLINHLAGQIDLDIRDRYGRTMLMLTARRGWDDIFSHLINAGHADLNAVDHDGRTALMHSLRGSPGVDICNTLGIAIRLLGKNQVDFEIKDVNGESAVTWMRKMVRKRWDGKGEGAEENETTWRHQLQAFVQDLREAVEEDARTRIPWFSGKDQLWGEEYSEMRELGEGWDKFTYSDEEAVSYLRDVLERRRPRHLWSW